MRKERNKNMSGWVDREGELYMIRQETSHIHIFTARKRSCGKVRFLHLCVILLTGRVSVRDTCRTETPPGQRYPPTVTSGRYASHWNASLLLLYLIYQSYTFNFLYFKRWKFICYVTSLSYTSVGCQFIFLFGLNSMMSYFQQPISEKCDRQPYMRTDILTYKTLQFLLPPTNEVAGRSCFHTCLSVTGRDGAHPQAEPPHQADTHLRQTPPRQSPPQQQTPPPRQIPPPQAHTPRQISPRQTLPRQTSSPPPDGHWNEEYASYWNAFLLMILCMVYDHFFCW